jgi:hypothetical protein
LFLLFVVVSVCLWQLRDSLLDCVQVLHQFTLEAPQSADGHLFALINKLTLFCNMQLNVLNDLAEAMKALEGKNGYHVRVDPAFGVGQLGSSCRVGLAIHQKSKYRAGALPLDWAPIAARLCRCAHDKDRKADIRKLV